MPAERIAACLSFPFRDVSASGGRYVALDESTHLKFSSRARLEDADGDGDAVGFPLPPIP
jgi:hypothetical protein